MCVCIYIYIYVHIHIIPCIYIYIYIYISIYGIVKPHKLINQQRFWTLFNWVSLLPRCTLSAPSRTETNFKTTAFCSSKTIAIGVRFEYQGHVQTTIRDQPPKCCRIFVMKPCLLSVVCMSSRKIESPHKACSTSVLRTNSGSRSPVCHSWVSSKSTSHHGLCLCMSV